MITGLRSDHAPSLWKRTGDDPLRFGVILPWFHQRMIEPGPDSADPLIPYKSRSRRPGDDATLMRRRASYVATIVESRQRGWSRRTVLLYFKDSQHGVVPNCLESIGRIDSARVWDRPERLFVGSAPLIWKISDHAKAEVDFRNRRVRATRFARPSGGSGAAERLAFHFSPIFRLFTSW